jgi:hypothetical protein
MRIFVKNKLNFTISEKKPSIGTFTIKPGERVEIFDVMGEHKVPLKKTVPYVINDALEIAQSIVQDFGRDGLEIEMEDDDDKAVCMTVDKVDSTVKVDMVNSESDDKAKSLIADLLNKK